MLIDVLVEVTFVWCSRRCYLSLWFCSYRVASALTTVRISKLEAAQALHAGRKHELPSRSCRMPRPTLRALFSPMQVFNARRRAKPRMNRVFTSKWRGSQTRVPFFGHVLQSHVAVAGDRLKAECSFSDFLERSNKQQQQQQQQKDTRAPFQDDRGPSTLPNKSPPRV